MPAVLILAILIFGPPVHAELSRVDLFTYDQFVKQCKEFRAGETQFTIARPPLGQVRYVDTRALDPGQSRFSFERLHDALAKMWNKGTLKAEGDKWILPHEGGQALLPESRAVEVFYWRGRLITENGTHRAMISSYVRAPLTPVLVTRDLSHLSRRAMEAQTNREGTTYYRSFGGIPGLVLSYCDMIEDPLLWVVRQALLRVEFRVSASGEIVLTDKMKAKLLEKAGQSVAALKLNSDLRFLELILADELYRSGYFWNEEEPFTVKDLKRILSIWKQSRNPVVQTVLLLDQVRTVAELQVESRIAAHIRRVRCAAQVTHKEGE